MKPSHPATNTFWLPSVCYSSLSWEGAAGFQIKVKQVNFNLHSREHFAGIVSWNQSSCFRRVTVYRQHPIQWVLDVSQGFYMLPPYKLVIIIGDINFATEITNKDQELSLFMVCYFYFLSWTIFLIPWGYHKLWGPIKIIFSVWQKEWILTKMESFLYWKKSSHVKIKDLWIVKLSQGAFHLLDQNSLIITILKPN